jgi:probable HAF family extracellular repeat protein
MAFKTAIFGRRIGCRMSQQQWFCLSRTGLKLFAPLLMATMSLIGGSAAAATYTVVSLATLTPSLPVIIHGPNSAGLAVGSGKEVSDTNGDRGRRGLVFRSGAAALEIPGLAAETDDSAIFGLNDAGDFVGTANTATAMRAFIGTPAGVVKELPPLPGDTASSGHAVNRLRQAVGLSSGADGQRAVIWDADGTPKALPVTSAMSSGRATGINARGDVSGVVRVAGVQRPVLWQLGQAANELVLLAGHVTGEVNAINARGDAVGYSAPVSGARRATLWPSGSGLVVDLGTLPGGDFSQAFDSNDAGDVVGSSTTESVEGSRAFLWTRSGGIQDLNALIPPSSFLLTKAVGINNLGMIIATGHDITGAKTSGAHSHDEAHDLPVRVFLLTRSGAIQ